MNKYFFIIALFNFIIFDSAVLASEVDDSIKSSVVINESGGSLKSNSFLKRKEVHFMDPKLTSQQKSIILKYYPTQGNMINRIDIPTKIYIGMNGVPVLDQGKYGTCVTFAITAIIDALLGKGDYISQLCNLKLGEYFSSKAVRKGSGGWWGSSEEKILNQINSFGFINKDNQKTKYCGGVSEYPLDSENIPGVPMTLDEFQSMREGLFPPSITIMADSLLTLYQRFTLNPANPLPPYDGDKILIQIKQFLAAVSAKSKDSPLGLVAFGVLLPVQYCSIGACGNYHKIYDTWVVTKAIADVDPSDFLFKLAGHEMIIIGYDDTAVSIDYDGIKHKGLLILRNSFGDNVGDHGDYYMAYDFFKKFAISAQIIYQPDYCLLFDCKKN
jgi:hypothetical protein